MKVLQESSCRWRGAYASLAGCIQLRARSGGSLAGKSIKGNIGLAGVSPESQGGIIMGSLLARGLGKALLSAAIIATAIAATPASAETVINRGFGASPDTLDPHMNFGAREGWIQDDMYEGLTASDAKG